MQIDIYIYLSIYLSIENAPAATVLPAQYNLARSPVDGSSCEGRTILLDLLGSQVRGSRAHAAQVVLEHDVVRILGEPASGWALVCVDACRPVAAVHLGGKD